MARNRKLLEALASHQALEALERPASKWQLLFALKLAGGSMELSKLCARSPDHLRLIIRQLAEQELVTLEKINREGNWKLARLTETGFDETEARERELMELREAWIKEPTGVQKLIRRAGKS